MEDHYHMDNGSFSNGIEFYRAIKNGDLKENPDRTYTDDRTGDTYYKGDKTS